MGKGKKILIWGTGKISSEVWCNGLDAQIVGFIETNKKKEIFHGITVYAADENWPEHDYIIVANDSSGEIYQTCKEQGICLDNIIFLRPIRMTKRIENSVSTDILREILGEKNYTDYCIQYGLYQESFFGKDCVEYDRLNTRERFKINKNNLWPVISDKYLTAGQINNYF